MISSSTMQINPDIEDCFTLRGWYDTSGSNETFKSHSGSSSATSGFGFNRSELKGLDEVKQAAYGMPGNPENFSARGTIMHIKSEPLSYPACSNEGCSKKVEEVGEAWRCEKCDQSFNEPKHRYVFLVRDLGNTNQDSSVISCQWRLPIILGKPGSRVSMMSEKSFLACLRTISWQSRP